MSAPIRILVVDDDALVRSGISMILAATDDLRVVAEAADGDQVLPAVGSFKPDVVLMDLRMPKVGGLAATRELLARAGAPKVIVLTTFDADEQVLGALRAGASGFLLKDTPPQELVDAIRRVAAGEMTLSPAVTRKLVTHVTETGSPGRRDKAMASLVGLTEREREVADAVGRGRSNAQIGAELSLSVATVKAHVSSLLTKLELENRVQVALLVHDSQAE